MLSLGCRRRYLHHETHIHMSNFILSIEDLEMQTGLTRHYIDKCFKKLPTSLEPTRQKSAHINNKWFYNSNALVYLQQIRHLRDLGKNLREIKIAIEGAEAAAETTIESREGENQPTNAAISLSAYDSSVLLDALKDSHQETLRLSRDILKSKDEQIEILRHQLKSALPEGRSPEQVRADLALAQDYKRQLDTMERKAEDRKALLDELKDCEGFGKRKRRRQIISLLSGGEVGESSGQV